MADRMFVIIGCTDSGDEFSYVVKSDRRPTSDEVNAIIFRDWEEEYTDVGGVHWDIEETTFSPMPTQDEIDNMMDAREGY